MTRNIYLVRHGHREDFIGDSEQYNHQWAKTAKNRFDPALSPFGESQAHTLAEKLKSVHIDHLFSSPFLRTIETAAVIGAKCGLKVKIEDGLSEWLKPQWFPSPVQHVDLKQLTSMFPNRIDTEYFSIVHPCFPEPFESEHVWPRVAQTINLLLRNFYGDLLLVGHGASIVGAAFTIAGGVVDIKTPLCSLIHFRQHEKDWELIADGSSPQMI